MGETCVRRGPEAYNLRGMPALSLGDSGVPSRMGMVFLKPVRVTNNSLPRTNKSCRVMEHFLQPGAV